MSKDTTNVPGMDNATAGYLAGKIKDGETLVGEELYNDIMQFFQKIMSLAGLAANDDYDNENNGYQFVDALIAKIRATTATTAAKGTVEKATTAEAQAGIAEKFLDAALLQTVTATISRKGIVEKATTAEAQAGTAEKFLDAAQIKTFTGGLLTKEIAIGDWDMNTTPKITVAHGLSDVTKIRGNVGVIIYDDFGVPQELKSVEVTGTGVINGGTSGISPTTISLTRTAGALFDNLGYATTPLNRGYITIYHLP